MSYAWSPYKQEQSLCILFYKVCVIQNFAGPIALKLLISPYHPLSTTHLCMIYSSTDSLLCFCMLGIWKGKELVYGESFHVEGECTTCVQYVYHPKSGKRQTVTQSTSGVNPHEGKMFALWFPLTLVTVW